MIVKRETVIGAAKSELVLRLNAKLPIRYIYQDADKYFLEDFDTILKIVQKAAPCFDKVKLEQFVEENRQSYFDMRECFHIIDTEFLPDALHKEFSLQEEELHSELPKDTMKGPVSKIISDYRSGNIDRVLDELCGKRSLRIKMMLQQKLTPGTEKSLKEKDKKLMDARSRLYQEENFLQKIIDELDSNEEE